MIFLPLSHFFLFLDLDVAAFAVMITTEGEVNSYLKLDHILKRSRSWNESEMEAKESDVNLLRNYIKV